MSKRVRYEVESHAGVRRRQEILELLEPNRPVSGEALATAFGVSRQAIVRDIALLRAGGEPIVATVRGYLSRRAEPRSALSIVAVRHRPKDSVAELTAIVDLGVRVADVIVEHVVYGELRAELHLISRADVAAWQSATLDARAHLLSELTDGVHLHTLEAENPARLAAARAALDRLGILLRDDEEAAAAVLEAHRLATDH